MISMKLTKNEIKTISKDNRVQMIYFKPDIVYQDACDISIPLIRADYTRDTLGYTGSGIKIGQIESDMPDKNQSYFTATNIHYDPNVTETHSDHANLVASIMVAKSHTVNGVTIRGIAPDAQLYCTKIDSDFRQHVEWLLSQGVNVINMSAGVTESGIYGLDDIWVDHVSINHSVHFVAAAGNNSDGYVMTPAMAYNAIAVGSINDNNTLTQTDDSLSSYSSYVEASGTTNKPDLVAPGENIITGAGQSSGTSFAAPHVTAVIAQLLQQSPALKTLQDGMKAILTAAVNHSYIAYDSGDADFSKCGAGVIDSRSASWVISNSRYRTSTFAANSANGSTVNYYFNVTSSDSKIRVSLAWLKYNTLSGQSHITGTPAQGRLADLDLSIYDPNNNRVDLSWSTTNNIEICQFTPNVTGQYRIEVKQYSNSDKTVYFGVAWW